MTAEKKEAFPLSWPEDWPRTRPQDQRAMASWKRNANQYREDLAKELDRIKAPIAIISTNVPINVRGLMTAGVEPRDVGVAIYFSKPAKEDFRWQDALGLHMPAPTDEEIQAAYRRLAAQHHPDKGGDIEMFRALTQHRDTALRWANRAAATPQHVIACDLFKEVRLNLAAIAFTLKAIRQIDRCGTSSMLERSFKGFLALAADAGPTAGAAR
jgi:DnaJ-like protein